LRIVVIVSCRCVLLSSSDKADHSLLKTTAAYKVFAEQLIMEQIIKKLNNFHDW